MPNPELMLITHIPEELFFLMGGKRAMRKGECYSNSGLVVLLSSSDSKVAEWLNKNEWTVAYALGVLSPPARNIGVGFEHDDAPVAHAWIEAKNKHGVTYAWDPTLQGNSPLWGFHSRKFIYQKFHTMSAEDLKTWLRKAHPMSEFTDHGWPTESCMLPIIDVNGVVS